MPSCWPPRSCWGRPWLAWAALAARVEDLCLASDVLLTDYSSIMFDYANLDRPIIIYANDWETYKLIRGVTLDLLADPRGAVAITPGELVEVFRGGRYADDEARARLAALRARFCVLDDGHAAERVVRRVFLGEEPPTSGSKTRRPMRAPGFSRDGD